MKTIADIAKKLEDSVNSLTSVADLPDRLQPLRNLIPSGGYEARVVLQKRGRKIKSNAAAAHWNCENGSILITFEPAAELKESPNPSPEPTPKLDESPSHGIIVALDGIENEPGLQFVSLKRFRDDFLPKRMPALAESFEERHRVLAAAIEQGLIATYKVTNPKSPQFPTTAIRLNRTHPAVERALGGVDRPRVAFNPIAIRGEALSETILKNRR